MKSFPTFFAFILSGLLSTLSLVANGADACPANGVAVSCTCVDGQYSGDTSCTSTSYYQTGINVATGQVAWTRQVLEFGNCSTQEADQVNDCHRAIELDPFCHVN